MAKRLLCYLGRHTWAMHGTDPQHIALRCTSCGSTKPLKVDGTQGPYGHANLSGSSAPGDLGSGGGG
jgi:hypothetical protein